MMPIGCLMIPAGGNRIGILIPLLRNEHIALANEITAHS